MNPFLKAFLINPLRFTWWVFFGNFRRLVNWWAFWPFCFLGWHSRTPLAFMPPGHHGKVVKLGCRACFRELYGPFVSWEDCRRRGIVK